MASRPAAAAAAPIVNQGRKLTLHGRPPCYEESRAGIAGTESGAEKQVARVGGVGFHALTEDQLVAHVDASLREGIGGWIVTANLDHLRRCQGESEYGRQVRRADLVVADGMPIVWAAAIQGTPLPERVAGSSLVSTLARQAAASGFSLFLLGGDPGTAEAAARVLTNRFPDLDIAGYHCPAPGFEGRAEDRAEIERRLTNADPDIVYVALGSPKQEILIEQYRRLLPSAWWIGVGISFSYLAGDVKRPPKWVQRIGAEWLLRLIQEPGRMAGRYLVHGIPFALALFGKSVLHRLGAR